MIRGSAKIALALSAVLVGACQMGPAQQVGFLRGSAMDGNWASTDGVFVAHFQGGNFTSRFTQTNEVLAQGSYTVAGSKVSMQWLSVATQQQRSADCTMTGTDIVRCNQAGGGSFDLRRSA